jgi:general secretion pathway protein C
VVVWALVAASALAWGLKLFVVAPPLPKGTPVAAPTGLARADLTRLLGVDPPPAEVLAAAEPPADARFHLLGVVSAHSPQAAREGLALIAVDGKPARAYRVGALVDGNNVLKTVAARGVTLGPADGTAVVALNIAPPPPAATGTLPAPGGMPVRAPPSPPIAAPAAVAPAGLPQPATPAERAARRQERMQQYQQQHPQLPQPQFPLPAPAQAPAQTPPQAPQQAPTEDSGGR